MSAQESVEKHRLIALTDIENEPDDGESIVRLLLYSNVVDIEVIIATTSILLLHQEGWAEADYLRSIVKKGLPKYGMTAVGKGCDSDGSELIINALKKDDICPLWMSVSS